MLWLKRLDREQDNLRVALGWMMSQGQYDEMALLGWNVAPFWVSRGYLAEAQQWMEQALTGKTALSAKAAAMARCVLAFCAIGQGRTDHASILLEESLTQARSENDSALVAVILAFRAHAAARSRNFEASTAAGLEALALFDDLDWDWGRGLAYGALALAHLGRGESFQAHQELERSERLLRSDDSWWYLLVCLNVQIQVTLTAGNAEQAMAKCREGLDVAEFIGDTTALTHCLTSLAGALTLSGQLERAARLFGAAEALRERTGGVIHPVSRTMLYEQHQSMLRTSLPPDIFARQWAEGRLLTVEEALVEARCQVE